jgi:hypothetical protein|tara:strand:+ start:1143 stop:1895 length:753 start_codon:yes stop_codon:yes gene_type:complete
MERDLKYKLKPVNEIKENEILRMFILMEENYDFIDYKNFNTDLYNKDYIGLLIDNKDIIQGFTTYSINPKKYLHPEYNILFSGDTVISEHFVGSQELGRGWAKTVAFFMHRYPKKKLLWYLMSKGHRTYLYLPYFFKKYYPALEENNNDASLKKIIDECSIYLFSNHWDTKKGIVKFKNKVGQLKQKHIKKSLHKNNKYVDFFLRKNPGFSNGDELVCMTEISLDNLMRLPKLILARSLKAQKYLDDNKN